VNLYQVQRINYFENLLTSSLTNTVRYEQTFY